MKQLLEKVEGGFFEAMRGGWAAGHPSYEIPGPPGCPPWRMLSLTFHWLGITFTDRWGDIVEDNGSVRPGGSIIAEMHTIPVWGMRCVRGQKYTKEALPFLRKVLMETYRSGEFCGGRGRQNVLSEDGKLLYINNYSGSFEKFTADESIVFLPTNTCIGSHFWEGGLLI